MIKQLFVIVVLLWLNLIQAQNTPSNNVSSELSEIETETMKFEQFNHSLIDYNKAVKSYNAFVNFRNKNFKPEKSDADIQKMIDNGLKMSASAQTKLSQIQKPEGQLKINVQSLSKDIKSIEKNLKDQQAWLKNYLSKNHIGRKGVLMNLGDGIILR
ncbi:hypothetical protein [Flavobacterium sp. UBA7680]|uniref:hypothetical protein n=1 Tax=Flavobacterium sp. UBA7680 TaxID=1946559 RepID=UPI0025BAB8F9|nr:hypothetical protein [Flavobacterium sp. UBA7680]